VSLRFFDSYNAPMSIDKSGKWWVGTSPHDIKEFLEAYSAEGYGTSEFRQAKCDCGGDVFELMADDDEGCAKRICTSCGHARFICDSEEYWPDASPEHWKCVECSSTSANVGVGFSIYDDGEVRRLYVGERCSVCGVLGCFAGWKVGYSPSKQLLEKV
jgi:hypothetical protein